MTIAAIPATGPAGAAFGRRIARAMDVILHIGAHRCATTSFQHYLRANARELGAQGLGFWGPHRTRGGLLRGVLPAGAPTRDNLRRAARRLRGELTRREDAGLTAVLVSDENMLGFLRDNRDLADLYPAAAERLARHADAFGGRIDAIALNVRALDTYWTSALTFGVARGFGLPGRATLERVVHASRGWRDVVSDIARAAPGACLLVLPFERFAGAPEAQLAAIARCRAPSTHARDWKNRAPDLNRLRLQLEPDDAARMPAGDGRWTPFTPAQAVVLQARHARDMAWLRDGADGLARLIDPNDQKTAGPNPRHDMTRGRRHDKDDGRLEGAGRKGIAQPAG